VRVDFTRTERRVRLERGEAIFDVAADAARPFLVEAGNLRITVLGTRFAVNRMTDAIRVCVDHGRVRLESGMLWRRRELLLLDGQVAELAGTVDAAPEIRSVHRPAADGFAFKSGRVIFHRARLPEIAETLSRYRNKPLRVHPEARPSPPITAVVQLGDIDTFLRSLPSVYPVTVTEDGERTWLSSGPS
jgi:transmembrane sensor